MATTPLGADRKLKQTNTRINKMTNSQVNDSIGTDYPVQQDRLHRLLKEYQGVGKFGFFGVLIIEGALAEAEKAIASGNVRRIIWPIVG